MPQVKVIRTNANAKFPEYMSSGASGCDVTACLEKPIEIRAGKREAVPTGLSFEIPEGFEIQVRPRSGLAFKKGLTVINAPGTIDSDYRGEVMILMVNLGEDSITLMPGDRIAQLVLQKVERITWVEATSLEVTERNSGGFGSTGIR
jgi:dUTP pyrophosphatase